MRLHAVLLMVGLASAFAVTGCEVESEETTDEPTKTKSKKKPPKGNTEPARSDAKSKPVLELDKASYTAGDTIGVSFGTKLPKAEGKHWITLVKKGAPDNEWGAWHMVDSGVSKDELKTTEGGTFEVRLHDNYPTQQHHIIARKEVAVSGEASLLSLGKTTVAKGDSIQVRFSGALPDAEGKYWLTIVEADSPDTTWGSWHMVKQGATTDALKTAEKGRFEVRLHGGYPKKMHNVIARQMVTVE